MPKAYDMGLRRKVIEAVVLNGMKRCEVAEQFNLNRKTIGDWLKLYEATVNVQPSAHNYHGHSHKITDWQAFRVLVKTTHDERSAAEKENSLCPDEITETTDKSELLFSSSEYCLCGIGITPIWMPGNSTEMEDFFQQKLFTF